MSKAKKPSNTWETLRRFLTPRLFIYIGLFLAVSILAFYRYPTYWLEPNFYAEDGTVFAQNIIDKGILSALFVPFNGYLIAGVYLVTGVGFVVNQLFLGGSLLTLPAGLGVASYLFWGFLCTLPMLLFWNDFQRKTWWIGITAALALLPLPGFNYAIFTTGNAKFAFLYIAFLLLVKRMRMAPSKWLYAVDASLLVCALTNPSVYLMLPFALLPYWPGRKKLNKKFLRGLLKNKGFISLAVLFGLSALQIVYVAVRGGVDKLHGYLDTPYEWGDTIEIFIHRTLLFPFDHIVMKQLRDVFVLALVVIIGFALFKFARREDRPIIWFGVWSAIVGSVVFVSQRTGVSVFYNNYQSSGPDNFFYPQNMIILFMVLYVAVRFTETKQNVRYLQAVALLFLAIIAAMIVHHDFGEQANMNRLTGSFQYSAQQQCKKSPDQKIKVPLYPQSAITMEIDRSYCDKVADYIPPREAIKTEPANNNYVPVNTARVTQTFAANYDQLSGLSVFLSTFGDAGDARYALKIYDASCKNELRSVSFSARHAKDNRYFDIRFSPIADSKGKHYCFEILPEKLRAEKPPVAIQLSAPNTYQEGVARKDTTELTEDVVFDILYK